MKKEVVTYYIGNFPFITVELTLDEDGIPSGDATVYAGAPRGSQPDLKMQLDPKHLGPKPKSAPKPEPAPVPKQETPEERRAREIESFTAPLSRNRAAAHHRAQTTDDVFIPYLHYRCLRGVIVRRDALQCHFDALYERVQLTFGRGQELTPVRIEREDETHVWFTEAS